MKRLLLNVLSILLLFNVKADACTNFLFTKAATVDGSTMITYAADSHVLYGELYYWPGRDWPAGAMLDIYEWDTGKRLGQIKQVPHTYTVVGNMNEWQVSIGETTYGGRKELHHQPTAVVDYGSLIYIALQRSKTAREAIKVMTDLVEEYGYYSEGESFSIADPNEVWIMEMIGKGKDKKGAVWVALKIPDGYVCAHANQARIRTFPYQKVNKFDDPKATCFNSPDVISFAREKGWFTGKDKDFSFSDTYAPVDFGGARFCESRVWAMFRRVNSHMEQYRDYAMGFDLKNRMPLWVKPDKKLSLHDVMNLMRDHFEGTDMDMSKDIGAGPYHCPYRWRGLTWKVDSTTYFNERAVSTQQTGFSFVAQMRSWLKNPLGGIFWFGVDDTYSTVYTPVYSSIKRIPETYAKGNGSMGEWSDNSAFWTFNQVSNWAYTRYDAIMPIIRKKQQLLEESYIETVKLVDQTAQKFYQENPEKAIDYLTEYSCSNANTLVYEWKEFYHFLFMKFMDGNIKKTKNGRFIGNGNPGDILDGPDQPGYGEEWYRRIIKDTGKKFIYRK
jgi:dipeptidase